MPQITLECTHNIVEQAVADLLLQIHQILSKELPTELHNCKTRILRHQEYIIGDGDSKNAFVHLSINVLKGRSKELLSSIADKIMAILSAHFAVSYKKLNVQISIAIQDLPEVYQKNMLQ